MYGLGSLVQRLTASCLPETPDSRHQQEDSGNPIEARPSRKKHPSACRAGQIRQGTRTALPMSFHRCHVQAAAREARAEKSARGTFFLPQEAEVICPLATARGGHSWQPYGFSTTLPNIWLFSRYSCAARISRNGKVESTTGFSLPANTCFRTSRSSPMVPM
jgi:hypothetical protein